MCFSVPFTNLLVGGGRPGRFVAREGARGFSDREGRRAAFVGLEYAEPRAADADAGANNAPR